MTSGVWILTCVPLPKSHIHNVFKLVNIISVDNGQTEKKRQVACFRVCVYGNSATREEARWVWMGLAGSAVAEIRTFGQGLEVSRSVEYYSSLSCLSRNLHGVAYRSWFGGLPRSVDNGSHNELRRLYWRESISISGPGFKDWLRKFPDEGTRGERRSEWGRKRENTKWDSREKNKTQQQQKIIIKMKKTKNKTKRHKDTEWGEAANECHCVE